MVNLTTNKMRMFAGARNVGVYENISREKLENILTTSCAPKFVIKAKPNKSKAVHKAKQKRIPSPLQHRNMPQK